MDASQYKDYVLVLLFVKYVSDKTKTDKNFLIDVPEGGNFRDMVALKGKPNIGEGINTIIKRLAEANDLNGVIDVADFDDPDKLGKGKDMVDRLSNLVAIFEEPALDFSKNKAEGDDILGDAYEYLMRHFATESGKSKGQFYTPSEVSRVIAKVVGISKAKRHDQTVYDPTCGSGSLLIKAADETEQGITIYGQENEGPTRALAKMNMILHGYEMADIKKGNTISEPLFLENGRLKTFDFVVANPPFSNKNWSNGIKADEDEYERFEGFGIPPKKNGDYAFLLHMIKSLKSTGKLTVILPHGVLFRGNAESEIRKNIIKRGYIKGIIGLPPNLFYGTGIPACIIIIDKENAESRKGIFMIDARKGFYKDGNKNRLRSRDLHKIVDVFTKQIEEPKYSRMVSLAEISDSKNNYNLNIPRYIDSQEEEDVQDIEAHLEGDIPEKDIQALDSYWKVYPSLKKILFTPSKRKDYLSLKVEPTKVKSTIFKHQEFVRFLEKIEEVFKNWDNKNSKLLRDLTIGSKPKELIFEVSEDILSSFSNIELIDKYDIYQHLMNYWDETIQDDTYLIAVNGWKIEINILRNKKGKETGWDCDLIPKYSMITKYFSKEKETIEKLQLDLESVASEIQTLDEENSGEEDLFSEVRNEKGTITKKELLKRIKEIKADSEYADELKGLNEYSNLLDKEKEIKDKIKEVEADLDKKLLSKYKNLKENEIKDLVVKDKWMNAIHSLVSGELERVSQRLAVRIKELAERYETPLPEINKEVITSTKKVDDHLKNMGFKV